MKKVEKYVIDKSFKFGTKIVTEFIGIIRGSHSVFRLCGKYVASANTKKTSGVGGGLEKFSSLLMNSSS